MPVAEYMLACLQDPTDGYYRHRSAIGGRGDFTTAPEISQIFGELLGLWSGLAWRAMGAPQQVDVVELGPGRGTLLCDALRAARIVPGFREAIRLHLVESNSTLREVQRGALRNAIGTGLVVTWHDSLAQIAGRAPAIVLANEFLDAIPVRQLIHVGGSWRERCVTCGPAGGFIFIAGDSVATGCNWPDLSPADGDILELRPAFADLAQELARWRDHGLAALFIDYGYAQMALGDTLQAVSAHRYASVLERPGEVDLSAHVDFGDFARQCADRGLKVDGPISQAEFLLRLGLAERAARLMETARPDQRGLIEAGAHRISDPLGMGGRFKVLCIRSERVPVLAPFMPGSTQVAASPQ